MSRGLPLKPALRPEPPAAPATAYLSLGGQVVLGMTQPCAARLWVELSTTADPALLELRAVLAPMVINNKEDKTP